MSVAFPDESAEYRAARDRLLAQEIDLRRAMEAVAVARRELPPGGLVPEDYIFDGLDAGGAPAKVKLSELFASGRTRWSSTTSCSPATRRMTGLGPARARRRS